MKTVISLVYAGCITSAMATAPLSGCSSESAMEVAAPFQGKPDWILPGARRAAGLSRQDMNRDGRADIVVLAGNAGKLTVFFGRGEKKFDTRDRTDLEVGASASGFALADLNEDGKYDIAVSQHDANEIWLFLGKGNKSFEEPKRIRIPVTKPHAHRIIARDINRDRHLDLLLAQADDNGVWALLGDGKGGFAPSPGSPAPTGNHPYVICAADFNGDSKLDVATPNWYGKSVSVFLGDGTGSFKSAPRSPIAGFKGPTTLEAGDLTGDGLIDLALGNDDSSEVQILVGDGKGGFSVHRVPLRARDECFAPTLADFNRDGKLDIVANAQNGARTFSYWLNLGDGKFSPPYSLDCAASASSVCVADWNGDGVPDLAVGTDNDDKTLVWLGKKRPLR
jgi:hypothetical protein